MVGKEERFKEISMGSEYTCVCMYVCVCEERERGNDFDSVKRACMLCHIRIP